MSLFTMNNFWKSNVDADELAIFKIKVGCSHTNWFYSQERWKVLSTSILKRMQIHLQKKQLIRQKIPQSSSNDSDEE